MLMHLPALGCANHPCPTARPLEWSQSYETVSLTAADAAAEEPFDERMAAVMACGVDPCEDFYTYACGATRPCCRTVNLLATWGVLPWVPKARFLSQVSFPNTILRVEPRLVVALRCAPAR